MMGTKKLSKVLSIREYEEKNAQLTHAKSVASFEELAQKLYELLHKKETLASFYEENIQNTAVINDLNAQSNYIQWLNTKILHVQEKVNKARDRMENKQAELTHAHVEVKKIEKVIQQRITQHKQLVLKREQKQLDEVSSQQYLKRNIGE